MTYEHALACLPADARWSCSFGYPGEQGCVEYYRAGDGRRYTISNGRITSDWHWDRDDWRPACALDPRT